MTEPKPPVKGELPDEVYLRRRYDGVLYAPVKPCKDGVLYAHTDLVTALREENARYKEALEEIRDHGRNPFYPPRDLARKALGDQHE